MSLPIYLTIALAILTAAVIIAIGAFLLMRCPRCNQRHWCETDELNCFICHRAKLEEEKERTKKETKIGSNYPTTVEQTSCKDEEV